MSLFIKCLYFPIIFTPCLTREIIFRSYKITYTKLGVLFFLCLSSRKFSVFHYVGRRTIFYIQFIYIIIVPIFFHIHTTCVLLNTHTHTTEGRRRKMSQVNKLMLNTSKTFHKNIPFFSFLSLCAIRILLLFVNVVVRKFLNYVRYYTLCVTVCVCVRISTK